MQDPSDGPTGTGNQVLPLDTIVDVLEDHPSDLDSIENALRQGGSAGSNDVPGVPTTDIGNELPSEEVRNASKSRFGRMSPKRSGDILRRIGKVGTTSLMGRVAGATTAVLTEASSLLLDEISGCPVGLSNAPSNAPRSGSISRKGLPADLRGSVSGELGQRDAISERPRRERKGRAGEFRQRLDVLLATDSSARAVAGQLYQRFEGDLSRLAPLLQLLEDRWEFPTRVFPLLWVHIRRASGRSEDHGKNISEEEWAAAFDNWLQALRTRCGHSKVSRQCLVHTRHGDDWNKVYLKGAKLGEGSYGEVFLALHASLGVARVVKSVPKSQLSVAGEQVEDEVNMLKSLDHPHIVRVFEAFESTESLHIVMDYAEGGDLASVIRETLDSDAMLPHIWVQMAALQVASALDYMHSRGVIHCDLKPGNTMLLTPFVLADALAGRSKPHVLLVDFGLAEIFDEQAALGGPATVKGSPAYLSPEGFDGKLTQKSDTWALGVMLFEMLVGTRPFRGTNNIFVLYCQVANTEPAFDKIPPAACSLVRSLMDKNPQSRMSARQCFEHEWLQQVNTSAEYSSVNTILPKNLGRHTSYFHRAVTFSMAAALGMKELTEDYQLFQALDADKSGQLDQDELRSLAKGLRQDLNALMASMDLDQDGQISYTEFLGATLDLEEERGDRLMRYAFSTFDHDGDGNINMEELRRLLSGDGAMLVSDVLPDGHTVDEVMEEVSGGDGVISFSRFRSYLMHVKHGGERDAGRPLGNWVAGNQNEDDMQQGQGDEQVAAEPQDASDLLNRLDASEVPEEEEEDPEENSLARLESTSAELMGFHQWLDDLFQDQRRDARLNIFLRFHDSRVEAAYVSHYAPVTLRQAQVLALPVAAYSLWALLTENFRWEPSLIHWEQGIQVVNNLAWLTIFFGSLLMFSAIALWLWRRKRKALRVAWAARNAESTGEQDKASKLEAAKAEAEFDREAIQAEQVLCLWAVVTPWLCCFFANRRRLAALWDVDPFQEFPTVSTDYDLILTMLGTLMFFSMRTNLRFLYALPVALSCLLAYGTSSIVMASSPKANPDDFRWGWTAVLLIVSCGLCLSGHRNLEYQRRLSFISLYASFAVLKDIQVADPLEKQVPGSPRSSITGMTGFSLAQSKGPETRLARLKRGIALLDRLCTSASSGNQAFRDALMGLLEILSSAREDLAQAERLVSADIAEVLEQKGIDGEAKLKLLDLFDELPPLPPVPPLPLRVNMLEKDCEAEESNKDRDDKLEAWGWEVLPMQHGGSTSSTKKELDESLASAGEMLLAPVVSEAVGNDAGKVLLARLLDAHRSSPAWSEARAALALRATNWLAKKTGLWAHLEVGEKAALLAAAAGLHAVPVSQAVAFKQEQTGVFASKDPVLGHAASISSTALALTAAGLGRNSAFSERPSSALMDDSPLLRLTRRLQHRARPCAALQDLKRVRILLEADEEPLPFNVRNLQSLSSEELEEVNRAAKERRLLLAGLVLAAGDLAFLALPQKQHLAWAGLAREEREVGMCAADWLRGLAETLAIPLYDTLHTVGELTCHTGKHPLSVPLGNLRENARYWTKHSLAPSGRPSRRFSGQAVSPATSSKDKEKLQVGQAELSVPGELNAQGGEAGRDTFQASIATIQTVGTETWT